jgi:putative transcriptional regulator
MEDEGMGLQSNLSTLMGKHRYNIQDVRERTGLSRNTISSLYNDKATRIDFTTITKLCTLFECPVNELLVFAAHKDNTQSSSEQNSKGR